MRVQSLFFLVLVLAGIASAQTSVQTDFANAKKAKGVLDQMIAAMGGDAFMNVTETSQQGRTSSFYQGRPTGASTEFWSFLEYPDKERMELTKDRDWIIIYSGDKGSEITFRGVRPLDADDLNQYLRRREYRLDIVLHEWLKDPAVALFYDGTDLVEAQPVDVVTILNGKNQGVTLMIDSNTHLLHKKQFTVRDPKTGDRDEEAETYGNYHQIQGIATAYTITRYQNGDMSNERFLSDLSYNNALSPQFFDPNAKLPQAKKKK